MSVNSKPENADRTLSLALYVFFGVAVLASGVFFRDSLIAALYSLETTVERLDYWGPILVTLVASLCSLYWVSAKFDKARMVFLNGWPQ